MTYEFAYKCNGNLHRVLETACKFGRRERLDEIECEILAGVHARSDKCCPKGECCGTMLDRNHHATRGVGSVHVFKTERLLRTHFNFLRRASFVLLALAEFRVE